MTSAEQSNSKQLAIIRQVHCGLGDRGRAALWFSTYITEAVAALQVFEEWDKVKEIIEAYGVDDVYKLEGKACWVHADANMIRWAGPAKIG